MKVHRTVSAFAAPESRAYMVRDSRRIHGSLHVFPGGRVYVVAVDARMRAIGQHVTRHAAASILRMLRR